MVQVQVAGMIYDRQTRDPILLLHVPPLDRYLPIWIGMHEAAAIGMALKGERFERPLTHDLLVTVIDGLEARVTRVVIHDLRDGTFFAKVFLERGQQVIGVDARPSDSIAIAVRTGAPVFVAESVIEREGGQLLAFDPDTVRRILGGEDAPDDPAARGPGPAGGDPAGEAEPGDPPGGPRGDPEDDA